jgi:hypothetical protein
MRDGAPLLFETLVCWPNDSLDGEMERYATYHEAEQGHEAMVERVRHALAQRAQNHPGRKQPD